MGSPRLLLVEDNWLFGVMMAEALVEAGFDVLGPIADLPGARRAAASESFCCALVDLNLEGQMSYPVAEVLQSRDIPFVFLTGYERDAVPRRFEDVRFITKPADPDHLVAVMHGLARCDAARRKAG